jgi:DNA-binding response OmpR family regulator
MMLHEKILIAEDQRIIASVYSLMLSKKGYDVTITTNASDAFNKTKELNPKAIIMDVQLNGTLTGIDIARKLRQDGYDCLIIFTTGNLRENTILDVADINNCNVLIKPVEFSEIEKLLNNI